ncbi:DUF6279 family lipoprotein [Bdellovibrio sp. HCB337]|uniref:DUF6279 family lipoprotein n=1 Tax=Bdellovibrio sp. HCB337 TaxID=3394358 RepID=UPI0039A6CE7F
MNKFLLSLFCFLGIISCTRLDIAVNWADTYIASQVDDYFDLSSQQNKELKSDLKQDLRKIRSQQFPIWAKTLRQLEKEVRAGTLTEAGFAKYYRDAIAASQHLLPMFTDTAVEFISSASAEQLEHFERAIRKKNVENEQKIQNSEQARNDSRKKYLRWIEMWIESLTKDQDQLLNQHLNNNPFPARAQIKNRTHVLEKFTEARKSPESLQNFVRNYYTDKNQYSDPNYKQALTAYQADLEKFGYQLLNSLSEKQKSLLCENLTEKAALLEKLAHKE